MKNYGRNFILILCQIISAKEFLSNPLGSNPSLGSFFYYSENVIPNSSTPCSEGLCTCFEFTSNMLG